jgi:DNA-directed RNA polymerase specialized sigma24 family protein
MGQRREYPVDFNEGYTDPRRGVPRVHRHRVLQVHRHRPLTELEALMQERPYDGVAAFSREPLENTAALREALGEAIDNLPPEDRYIIEELFIAGNSLRKTGAILNIPKTTLARKRDRIRRHLMDTLVDHPDVRKWLRA